MGDIWGGTAPSAKSSDSVDGAVIFQALRPLLAIHVQPAQTSQGLGKAVIILRHWRDEVIA